MRRKFAIALAVSLLGDLMGGLAGNPALAADLIPPPPAPLVSYFDWTGIYLGGTAGYGYATISTTASIPLLGLSATASEDLSGVVAGGLIGGNIQFGPAVIGLEGDFNWSDQKFTTNIFGIQVTDRISQFATVRGRLGYAAPNNMLLFITGGGVWGKFESTASLGALSTTSSTTRNGWVIGAGFETVLISNLLLRVDVLYLQSFKHIDNSVPFLTVTDTVSDTITRLGLVYKFGGGFATRPAGRD